MYSTVNLSKNSWAIIIRSLNENKFRQEEKKLNKLKILV